MRISKFSFLFALIITFGIGATSIFFVRFFVSKTSKSAPITARELCSEAAMIGDGELGWLDSMQKLAVLQDRLRKSDIAALAAEMTHASLPPDSEVGVQLVAATLAEKDPQSAWDFALAMKSPDPREAALDAVISTISSKDPSHALKLSMNIEEGKGSNIPTIFGNWARIDLEGAKIASEQLSGDARGQARRSLVSFLVRRDPQSAWEYSMRLPVSPNDGRDARVEVIQMWAQHDPQAAFTAATSIAELEPREAAIHSVMSMWSFKDFNGALQYATAINDPQLRLDIFSILSANASEDRKQLLNAMIEKARKDLPK